MTRGAKKRGVLFLFLLLLGVFVLIRVINNSKNEKKRTISKPKIRSTVTKATNEGKRKGKFIQAKRIVHLDLKGAPPRLSYLKYVIKMISSIGCDFILIEYEDMFPYTGSLVNVSAKNAFTQREIRQLISTVQTYGMAVIPLVQTFGHMEFILKHERFMELRESTLFPADLCPKNPSSFDVVKEMLSQMIRQHPESPYIHIGCDEVFNIGLCPRCSAVNSKTLLYNDHVTNIAEWLKSQFPDLGILIWDDVIRLWPPTFLLRTQLSHLVVPVVWEYSSNVTNLITARTWLWYSKVFPEIWVAGAYKGNQLPVSDLPNLTLSTLNLESWASVVRSNHGINKQVHVTGWVLTGWSRFDHFAVLCELLPSAIPSLVLSLLYLNSILEKSGNLKVMNIRWYRALECPWSSKISQTSLYDFPSSFNSFYNLEKLAKCNWKGSDLYQEVYVYWGLKAAAKATLSSTFETNGWLTRYNVRHNFSNPWRIAEEFRNQKISRIESGLLDLKSRMKRTLNRYYDLEITEEWLEQKFSELLESFADLNKNSNDLMSRKVWPRRPL